MRILLTGAAGFIGYHVSAALAERGEEVLGVDCFTPYYARALKDARIARLQQQGSFAFQEMDVADHGAFKSLAVSFRPQKIVHLAAQAGVRYSLEAPFAYLHANVEGHLSALEAARGLDGLDHLVYASSGSVYGANTKVPFAEADRVDKPASLYSATKRSAELMSETYRRLFGIPQTGLRFFSVYGPWGRPDMAYWLFTEAVLKGQPIQLFDGGRMKRDWTYVDDIVNGVVAAIDRPPTEDRPVYNLGNNRPETGKRLLEVIEQATGQKAIVNEVPAPATELDTTYADITLASQDLGFAPATSLDEGIPRFVAWFRDYAGL